MTSDSHSNPQLENRLVLVTGPAGAGRSTAIRALEDIGYEAIDNLPLTLIPRLFDGPPHKHPIALGIDTRNRDFSTDGFLALLEGPLSAQPFEILYLDCSTEVLLRRYSETRRRHPLAANESPEDGIARDLDLLTPARSRADVLVDTSDLSLHDLRAEIERWFGTSTDTGISVSIQSFSYKRGLPRGLDIVFDCRFLRNPFWDPQLRALNGTSEQVADYVGQDERYAEFLEKTIALVEFLIPAHAEEGKSHLSIGFGCTGGQHRSVCAVEAMLKALARTKWQVSIRHRELERPARTVGPGTQSGIER